MPLSPDEVWATLDDAARAAVLSSARDRAQAVAAPAVTAAPEPIPEPVVEGPVVDDAGGWNELEDFLDDTLQLSYKGSHYTLQAADIDTGLECQMLLGVGVKLRRGGTVSQKQAEQLDDAEETDLFIRLLGGRQWLTAPVFTDCPLCGAAAGDPCQNDNGTDSDDYHAERGDRNPRYRAEADVWAQLKAEGRSWAFVQHVGTTAIFWAAFGPAEALEFWKSGGRPKAPQPPAPRQPQDHKATANTTRKRSSGSSTTKKPRAARKATGSAG